MLHIICNRFYVTSNENLNKNNLYKTSILQQQLHMQPITSFNKYVPKFVNKFILIRFLKLLNCIFSYFSRF